MARFVRDDVDVSVNVVETQPDDYFGRYVFGSDERVNAKIGEAINGINDAFRSGSVSEVTYQARKINTLVKNLEKIHDHNEMIDTAKSAILEVPVGGYVTRDSVREALFRDNGWCSRNGYKKFAYGASIVAIETLVGEGKLQFVRVQYGYAYKRI